MRMADMLPYIVTLGFVAIWALTQLFSREAEALPPRSVRPPGGNPQRPPAPGQPRRVEPTVRWSPPAQNPSNSRPPAGRPVRLDDDIVILEVEPKRPPAPATRPQSGGNTKRPGRTRQSSAPSPKKPDAAPPKLLSGTLSSSLSPLANRPVEFKPLSLPSATMTSLESAKKVTVAPAAKPEAVATVSALDINTLLKSPERLRESFILGMILQRPLRRGLPRR